jgi:hypothetical protein
MKRRGLSKSTKKKIDSIWDKEEISIAKFRTLSNKDEKQEIIDWLVGNCPFLHVRNFPKNIKISISEEIKERKPLFCFGEHYTPHNLYDKEGDMYIVKSGNAFSWIDERLERTEFDKKKLMKTKSARELQGKGIIPEIFCEGDTIVIGMDMLPSFDFFSEAWQGLSSIGKMNIVAGTPFEQRINPLVLIKIEKEELRKIFPNNNLEIRLLSKTRLSHMINSWRLWAQWTNNANIKILSVLYLYFIGLLPLQRWTFKGKEIDNGKLCFKKPRHLINGFEVGLQELALFIGLRRQTIDDHLLGNEKKSSKIKSIFESYSKLSWSLKCENILHEGYRFEENNDPLEPTKIGKVVYACHHTRPADTIEEIVLSPDIRKYI